MKCEINMSLSSKNQRYLNEIDSFGGKNIATRFHKTNTFGLFCLAKMETGRVNHNDVCNHILSDRKPVLMW